MDSFKVAILGGGAAGFFCAAHLAELIPANCVTIFERAERVLQKVKISGGGRCNVMNSCFDPKTLIKAYPRGSKELLGPFYSFGPQQTYDWFISKGIQLKTEPDGRMFPVSDTSQTIIDCLINESIHKGVRLYTSTQILSISKEEDLFDLHTSNGRQTFNMVLMATGSSHQALDMILKETAHTKSIQVPSLFTFNCNSSLIADLQGISVKNAVVTLKNTDYREEGPLLITHKGFSGPAILKLSAFAARYLFDREYSFEVTINWTGGLTKQAVLESLLNLKNDHPKKRPENLKPFNLPSRLWANLVKNALESGEKNFADVSKKELNLLAELLAECPFQISGKSTFKEEFVTAGGINLNEINFKNFESKLIPGLYFAGEILDIDAITGGYNFQAAWTGAALAAESIANEYQKYRI